MQGKQRWLGWIAIGLGALALAVALLGRGFGPGFAAAGSQGASAPQAYAQRGPGPQSDQIAPGANAQPSAGRQGQVAPGANAQPNAGRQGRGPQGGPMTPGGEARGQGGRLGNRGFGIGGWLGLPFRMIGGLFQLGMLAALVVLGLWLIRGRKTAAAPSTTSVEPAQNSPPAPLSPTGEAYIEEPSDDE
jgi:hypothetical protein